MFLSKVFAKGRSVLRRNGRHVPRGARLAQRPDPAQPHSSPRSKMLFNIDFLDEGHDRSSLTAACLKGARLERSLECRRREGKQATSSSIRLSAHAFADANFDDVNGSQIKLCRRSSRWRRFAPRLILIKKAEERRMHLHAAVIVDKTAAPKTVHEIAHSGTRGADHLRERLLAYLEKGQLCFGAHSKSGHQQQNTGQPLFA